MTPARILVIDDEPGIRFGVRDALEARGHVVAEADGVGSGWSCFEQVLPDLVILDHQLGDGTALDLLPRLQRRLEGVPVFILTAHGSIELAVQAVKLGAEQFLTKPVDFDALLLLVERCLNERRARRIRAQHDQPSAEPDPFTGRSALLQGLRRLVDKVLDSDLPLLLLGETGCGKSLLARWIHAHGPRRDGAFLDLNCAGFQRDFLESELFGHERGAFTGATQAKAGLLEVAHQGTVFLDEVGDMDPAIQAKLLKVLEEKRFRRMGGLADRRVDVRLIAATHQDLERLVKEGRFRADLHFRINAFTLRVPALRERPEDLADLVPDLLQRCAREQKRPPPALSPRAWAALKAHPWPGNHRELRNALERACLLCAGACIEPEDLALPRDAQPPGNLADLELQAIHQALQANGGKVGRTAKALGIARSTLYARMKREI